MINFKILILNYLFKKYLIEEKEKHYISSVEILNYIFKGNILNLTNNITTLINNNKELSNQHNWQIQTGDTVSIASPIYYKCIL